MNILDYFPIISIVLVGIVGVLEVAFKKVEDRNFYKILKISIVGCALIIQIIGVIHTDKIQANKEVAFNRKFDSITNISDSIQRLNLIKTDSLKSQANISDSLQRITLIKTDSLKLQGNSWGIFLRTYILRDSTFRIQYYSALNMVNEKDRPILVILDMKIIRYKPAKDQYIFSFSFKNEGERSLDGILGKFYIITNTFNKLSVYLSNSLPVTNTFIMPKQYQLHISPSNRVVLKDIEIEYSPYFYIRGVYSDLITKKTYPIEFLYKLNLVQHDTNAIFIYDTLYLPQAKNWELNKIRNFIDSEN